MDCRSGCGACCIAPTITSKIPGMPTGKPSGISCVNLDHESFKCHIWEQPDYPGFCGDYQACDDMCGQSREEALANLYHLEKLTKP